MVVTKSVSRFARNTVTLLRTVRMLKSLGIDVFFEEQCIYTLSAEGEVMLTLLGSFAQAESLFCSDNVKWRIRKGFEEGKASTCTMLGYRLVKSEIKANYALCLDAITDDSALQAQLEDVNRECGEISTLINNLLTVGSKQKDVSVKHSDG